MYVREGNGTPLQYSCLENPMGGGAWKAAVHGVAEGRTLLSDFTFTFHFHALEKEMAIHSIVLAWRIPGMGGAWWAAAYGVAQNRTWLTWLGSSSNAYMWNLEKWDRWAYWQGRDGDPDVEDGHVSTGPEGGWDELGE